MTEPNVSVGPRSKSWKGVVRHKSNRTTESDLGSGGGSRNIFRSAMNLFRVGSKRTTNVTNASTARGVTNFNGDGDGNVERNRRHSRGHRRSERKCYGNKGGGGETRGPSLLSHTISDFSHECSDSTMTASAGASSVNMSTTTPEDVSVNVNRASGNRIESDSKGARDSGADTDSPSSISSLSSAGSPKKVNPVYPDVIANTAAAGESSGIRSPIPMAVFSTPPPSYETFFPPSRGRSAKAIVAPPFKSSKPTRSRSDRHVMMRGTSSTRQRASGSFKMRWDTERGGVAATTAKKASMAPQMPNPPATSSAVLRAAYGKKMPPLDELFGGVPRRAREKVALDSREKAFIRLLETGDNRDWEVVLSTPPLLGPERVVKYAPTASSQAAWVARTAASVGGGRRRHCKSEIRTMVPVGLKKTLVLDLDETLVSTSRVPCDCDFKIVFKLKSEKVPNEMDTFAANADAPNAYVDEGAGAKTKTRSDQSSSSKARVIKYYVRIRPGLIKFLEKTLALYELVIWTASGKSYADAILDCLDPQGRYFSKRLYREACVRHKGLCIKDLRRLGRPMESVILLDNYVYSFGFTLDNGVPISSWAGNEEAKESGLMMAYSLLKHVAKVPDVRIPLIMAFDLYRRIHGTRPPLPPPTSVTPPPTSTNAPGPPSACLFASSPGVLVEA